MSKFQVSCGRDFFYVLFFGNKFHSWVRILGANSSEPLRKGEKRETGNFITEACGLDV